MGQNLEYEKLTPKEERFRALNFRGWACQRTFMCKRRRLNVRTAIWCSLIDISDASTFPCVHINPQISEFDPIMTVMITSHMAAYIFAGCLTLLILSPVLLCLFSICYRREKGYYHLNMIDSHRAMV
ncbi:hypothetical protein L596_006482 [Steinernema carpocapsae]|uniref:Uncharacterized protein n=1 Tax=Steinernema carpocapsae TaxID=34508 RepID=A0A4U8V2A5_STECR|nr:hypothetical protein L596_006482 [Steinernema carpocapsae]